MSVLDAYVDHLIERILTNGAWASASVPSDVQSWASISVLSTVPRDLLCLGMYLSHSSREIKMSLFTVQCALCSEV